MTREDIIRMAREAGLMPASFCRWSAYSDDLERFAALVAAAEREACAQIAARWDDDVETRTKPSDAIRAREMK